jgi:hypothetical protein
MADEAPQRRRRGLLKMYYGTEQPTTSSGDPLDINAAS